MKRVFLRLVAFLLITMFTLPTVVFASNRYGNMNYSCFMQTITNTTCVSDVFNVPITPSEEYDGYIFQLVEDATISLTENEGIQVLFAPRNLFRADTLQDIIDFVAPELIMYIEPDYIISRGPMLVSEPLPPTFAPRAFGSVNDPRYRYQWCLEFIRGAAAWSTIPAPSTNGIIVAVIDSGIHRDHEDFDSAKILPGRNFVVSPERNVSLWQQ